MKCKKPNPHLSDAHRVCTANAEAYVNVLFNLKCLILSDIFLHCQYLYIRASKWISAFWTSWRVINYVKPWQRECEKMNRQRDKNTCTVCLSLSQGMKYRAWSVCDWVCVSWHVWGGVWASRVKAHKTHDHTDEVTGSETGESLSFPVSFHPSLSYFHSSISPLSILYFCFSQVMPRAKVFLTPTSIWNFSPCHCKVGKQGYKREFCFLIWLTFVLSLNKWDRKM